MQSAACSAVPAAPLPDPLPAYLARLEIHQRGGHGLVLYGAGREAADRLAAGLRRCGVQPALLASSVLEPDPAATPGSSGSGGPPQPAAAVPGAGNQKHLIVLQDLPLPAFASVASRALQAARQAWREGTPVSWVSALDHAEYADLGAAAAGLHDSPAAIAQIRSLLTAEQLATLVEEAGAASRPAPASPGTPAADATAGRQEPAARPQPQEPVDPGLDADQLRAVETDDCPARVLAPAGSGKTRVLTSRVALLLQRGVPPSSVLALAFNRRAAEEMAARLEHRGIRVASRLDGPGVAVRTFHSLGNEVLQRELGWRYSEDAGTVAARLAAEAFQRHSGLEPGTYRRTEAQEFLRYHVSRAKTCLLPTADVHLAFDGRRVPFGPLFASFVRLQREAGHYEYDDMVYQALLILLRSATWRQRLQRRFLHVLVDEYQDLNPAQLLLADLLALPHDRLFVVGDDDQVIYGWRGARVEHLLDFEALHPGARTFVLSTNYRSSEEIVRLSQNLIGCNRRRLPKGIRPVPGAPAGRVDVLAGGTLGEQARQAAAWMAARRQDQGCSWDAFAVLARYRVYHWPLALALDAGRIPHTPVDGGSLLTQQPARVLLAYLNLALHPEHAGPQDCRWAVRVPERYLPRRVVDGLTDVESLHALVRRADLGEWHRAQARDLLEQLAGLRSRLHARPGGALEAATVIIEDLGVRAHYRAHSRPGRLLDEAREEIVLDVLLALAAEAGSRASLVRLLNAPAPAVNGAPAEPAGRVLLATIHATKGEGFPNVVLFNLRQEEAEDGVEGGDVEDERRVYYVGLTRAMAAAAVTVPRGQHSTFVREMVLDPALSGCGLRRLRRRATRLARRASARSGSRPAARVRTWLTGLWRRCRGRPSQSADPGRDPGCGPLLVRLRREIACREALGKPPRRRRRNAH